MHHDVYEVSPAVVPGLPANIQPARVNADERSQRLKQLANVFIDLYLAHQNNKIAESPAEFLEAA